MSTPPPISAPPSSPPPSAAGPPAAAIALAAPPEAAARRKRRVVGAVVAVLAFGLLTVAAILDPAERGLGTHEQFGLAPCGWITLMDVPCPTCGMTTSFAHAANGDFLASAAAQPFGFLLALATAMAGLVGSYVASTGSRLANVFPRLWSRGVAWLLIGLFVGAWAYKVVAYRL